MHKAKQLFAILSTILSTTIISQPGIASTLGKEPTQCPSAAAMLDGVNKHLGSVVGGNGVYIYKYEFPHFKYKFDTDYQWMVGVFFDKEYSKDGIFTPVKILNGLGNYWGTPHLQQNNSSWVCSLYGSVKVDGQDVKWAVIAETEA